VIVATPRVYNASAVVAAPALVGGAPTNQYTGSQGVSQFVAAFEAAATSPQIVNKVAAADGVGPLAVDDGLVVTQVGASPIIRLTYSSTKKSTVAPIAHDTAAQTLSFLFGSQIQLAQKQVDEATAAVHAANQKIAALAAQNGSVEPAQLYNTRLQQIASLEQQQLNFQAQGNPAAAAAIGSALQGLKAKLAALNPLVTQYQALSDQKAAAAASLATAQQALQAARSQAAAADPSHVVAMTAVHPTQRTPVLLQKALPAIGAGLFLAIGLVIVLELVSRRRTQSVAPAPPQQRGDQNGTGTLSSSKLAGLRR
jgi:hypothetical protein